ncbi:hypothetical protein [Zeaxanthinibacter enoshimensis]|uniref:Uncharacterized protein n=1 Tax=Zeaxanthinibacter enoshimensis TaxID=392009 RepID=A0A4R6TM05_9FLAO|nr:hypothetical protein [Zeaxanthinibacter enoshimensis]TDQ30739.1 hypothetical protein CLV82_1428 [Zeaxanthinibacter enoshimensis]
MKKSLLLLLLVLLTTVSCKNPTEKPGTAEEEKTILEKVAYAHGYEHWKDVRQIQFTFNVDRDTTHFERHWRWEPGSQAVTMQMSADTLSYNRKEVDSLNMKADASFINDKYWLLAPYQLVWDQDNFEYEYQEAVTAPVSGSKMNKLTIVYGNEGGYTPGDAYDFYLGEDYRVKEWSFRKANAPEPNLSTTWEDYKDFGGLLIATMHKNEESGSRLYFTDLKVAME